MPKNTTVDPQAQPAPQLEKQTRRIFSTEYKLSIIQKADV